MRIASYPALVILILAAIQGSPPIFAQKPPKPSSSTGATLDSTRWWTLSDEVTPRQLRAIHEDVELHQERYRVAVSAGTQRLLPKEQMERLSFFIDGGTHPELLQMWLVFSSFAAGFAFDEVDPRVSLAEFGFADEVQATIARVAIEFWHQREKLQERVREEMKAVEELVRLGKGSLGQKSYDVAIKAKDAAMLANATGYSVGQVEKLLKLWWEETPTADLAARTLPLVKQALGPTDWERFRRYLLEVQAPKMSASGYAEIEGN